MNAMNLCEGTFELYLLPQYKLMKCRNDIIECAQVLGSVRSIRSMACCGSD